MNPDENTDADHGDDRDVLYEGGDLGCDDRRIVRHDAIDDSDSASVCGQVDEEDDFPKLDPSRSKSLTLHIYLTDLGVPTSSPVSPATPTERAGGVYTQMFR